MRPNDKVVALASRLWACQPLSARASSSSHLTSSAEAQKSSTSPSSQSPSASPSSSQMSPHHLASSALLIARSTGALHQQNITTCLQSVRASHSYSHIPSASQYLDPASAHDAHAQPLHPSSSCSCSSCEDSQSSSRTSNHSTPSARTSSPQSDPRSRQISQPGSSLHSHRSSSKLLGSVSTSLLHPQRSSGLLKSGSVFSNEGVSIMSVRAFHPWYYHSRLRDHKITAMKSVEDLEGLLEDEKMKLSFINLARFMQRLHQLMPAPRGQMEPGDAMRVDSLAQEVGQLMKKRAKWYCPRFGAMAIHQSALVGYTDPEMLDLILPRVLVRMEEAYSKDLALLLNGLAMHNHPGSPEFHSAIFNFLEVKIPTQRVPPENVSRILKSMIRLGVAIPPSVLQLVAEDLMLRQSIFSPENMAGVVWALAYSNHPALLDDRALNTLCAHMTTHAALCGSSMLMWFICSVDVLLKGLDMKALQARAPVRHGTAQPQDGGVEAVAGGSSGSSDAGSGGLSLSERRAVWERLPAGGALLKKAAELALKDMPTSSPENATKALLYLGGYTGLRLEGSFHMALADRVAEGIATYTNLQKTRLHEAYALAEVTPQSQIAAVLNKAVERSTA